MRFRSCIMPCHNHDPLYILTDPKGRPIDPPNRHPSIETEGEGN